MFHRFTALDSLRGIAALGVVLHHLPASNGLAALPLAHMGSLFVDFFFVLSGFVIACSYGDKLAGGFPLRRFAVLRLGRVVPVHLLMIGLFLVLELLAWALGAGGLSLRAPFTGSHSLGHLFSATFLLDGYVPHRQNYYNGVSWSISVELFLYALAALAFRLRGGMKRKFERADPQRGTFRELRFVHFLPVDVRAVAAAGVAQPPAAVRSQHDRVNARTTPIVQHDAAIQSAA